KTVLLEGKVTGRCQGSGCWVSLDTGDPEKPFYVKSADESFVFPKECEGRTIRVQGVMMEGAQAAEHKHQHEEGEHEPDHVCPTPQYFVNPQAMKVVAGSATGESEKETSA
ncbi:MAG TPA: DUF4920 domain-containing protein, partial [Bacteroidetes bacterium]|nr:DUF4920 domain-containing protein [Bacteroidota bacterium]